MCNVLHVDAHAVESVTLKRMKKGPQGKLERPGKAKKAKKGKLPVDSESTIVTSISSSVGQVYALISHPVIFNQNLELFRPD